MDRDLAIDPRLLHLEPTASSSKFSNGLQALSELDTVQDFFTYGGPPPVASSVADSPAPFTVSNLLIKAVPSLGISEMHNTEANDFEVLFRHFDIPEDDQTLDVYAANHLALWIAKNRSIELSEKRLRDFEGVTAVPVPKLSRWLDLHGKSLLANANSRAPDRTDRRSLVKNVTYRVRCTTSEVRYRSRNADPNVTRVFHRIFQCTKRCGQIFERRGDWSRHEKVNFEE